MLKRLKKNSIACASINKNTRKKFIAHDNTKYTWRWDKKNKFIFKIVFKKYIFKIIYYLFFSRYSNKTMYCCYVILNVLVWRVQLITVKLRICHVLDFFLSVAGSSLPSSLGGAIEALARKQRATLNLLYNFQSLQLPVYSIFFSWLLQWSSSWGVDLFYIKKLIMFAFFFSII